MRAIIVGGTGFIGRALTEELQNNGWKVHIVSRTSSRVQTIFGNSATALSWEDKAGWASLLGPKTALVNLAGESIAGRWTEDKKQRILQSRLQAGERLCQIIEEAGVLPATFIQASAVGFYGPHKSTPLTESSPQGSGFLAEVATQWEDSTKKLENLGIRRCLIRTGMVLGHGGALQQMLPAFKLFLGGPVGDGHQGVSWIHIVDEVRAIRFLMESDTATGPYNLTAPNPTDYATFAKTLGKSLARPSWLRAPKFAMRALFGAMADEILLSGQFALPEALLKEGFTFAFPELGAALQNIIGPE